MKTRRETLKLALGSLAASAASPQAIAEGAAAPIASRIIDTHTHFYDPTRPQGVPWPEKESPLYRPVYPKDWAAAAGKHGIKETVVVEASKLLEDNDWILNLASTEKCIIAFIGNLQPAHPEFPTQLKRLAANPLFRGIRVSGPALLDNIESSEFLTGARLLADLNLSLDVNAFPDPAVIAAFSAKLPTLRIMIDHCGGCGDAGKLKTAWKDGMTACAKQRNVFCKVSALPEMTDTPPGKAPAETAYYQPVLDHLWERFGPDRLVYGSNWPVSDKGAPYDTVFKIVSNYFGAKGAEACEKYFWKNSLACYQWAERK